MFAFRAYQIRHRLLGTKRVGVAVTSRDDNIPGAAFCSTFSADHFPALQSSAGGLLFHDQSFNFVGRSDTENVCVYFAKIVNHSQVDFRNVSYIFCALF